MNKPIGRPMKYRKFIDALEDEVVYTPAAIVRHGEGRGLLDPDLVGQDLKKERMRIRHALARFSANHFFPADGDGLVFLQGQAPHRGWFGHRWKGNLPELGL